MKIFGIQKFGSPIFNINSNYTLSANVFNNTLPCHTTPTLAFPLLDHSAK